MTTAWDCEAYGEGSAAQLGILCFFSEDARVCPDLPTCQAAMAAERRRVHGIIHERAKTGDPVFEMLAEEFPTPESMLNGDDDL